MVNKESVKNLFDLSTVRADGQISQKGVGGHLVISASAIARLYVILLHFTPTLPYKFVH